MFASAPPRRALAVGVLIVSGCGGGGPEVPDRAPFTPAPPLDPSTVADVRYEVDLTEAHTQRVQVRAVVPHDGSDVSVWWMPVWTPGSYLIREYARHIESIEAVGADGAPLGLRKVTKNRWEVDAAGQSAVTLRYTLYANEPSVRTNHVHHDGAVLNGAATFVVPQGREDGPMAVDLALPAHWSDTSTALRPVEDRRAHRYLARDLDQLIDAPILAGNLHIDSFDVGGVPHDLVRMGGDGAWDDARALEDVRRITEVVTDFWGAIPYDRYTYLNVVGDRRGGLEHMDSTLMMVDAAAAASDAGWESWLGLVSHEFFHTWNVKRLRPQGLLPYDYEREQYTPSLWISEGITSYYDDLLLVRAGLLKPQAYLDRLSATLADALGPPAAQVQSLAEASHDTWIKFYRPDDNRVNRDISYYRKGSVVAWLLDQAIRDATRDRVSLDDVMRTAWVRFADDGYTEEGFRALASELAGVDLSPFFRAYVDGTVTPDLGPALRRLGLSLEDDPDEGEPWLGLSVRDGMVVREVRRDSPAFEGGVIAGDELLGLGEVRLTPARLEQEERALQVGDEVEVLLARGGLLRTARLTVAPRPRMSWPIRVDRDAGRAAALRRQGWWSVAD